MKEKVVLVHLSDLHLGKEDTVEKKQNLLNTLSGLKPDYVVISGDIVDDICMYKKCGKDIVEEFFAQLGKIVHEKNIIKVAGNHDLRRSGIFKPLFKICPGIFKKHEFLSTDYQLFEGEGVIIFLFNSALNGRFLAQGEISNETLSKFEDDVRNKIQGKYGNFLKLAVLHHHPLPVPFTSTQELYRHERKRFFARVKDEDAFSILNNSGTFLYTLLRAGVDIILHGHMHVRSFARWLCVEKDGKVMGEIFITSPGSPFAPNPQRPFSFNVITKYPDKSTTITCYETDHPKKTFSQEGDPIHVIGDYVFISNEFEKAKKEKSRSIHYLESTYQIDQEGDLMKKQTTGTLS